MSRFQRTPDNDSALPERMRSEGGTALEQRLLNAAANEQPLRELVEKMALGIGIAPPPPGPVQPPATEFSGVGPRLVGATKSLLPWVSTAVAVTVAGAMWATRSTSPSPSISPSAVPRASASASASSVYPPASEVSVTEPEGSLPVVASSTPTSKSRSTAAITDIQEQIALLDAARAAVSGGAAGRALELVREYQAKYPTGAFGPEAAAIKIEALVKSGRREEAKKLAQRFAAEHRGTPLAERVLRLTGS